MTDEEKKAAAEAEAAGADDSQNEGEDDDFKFGDDDEDESSSEDDGEGDSGDDDSDDKDGSDDDGDGDGDGSENDDSSDDKGDGDKNESEEDGDKPEFFDELLKPDDDEEGASDDVFDFDQLSETLDIDFEEGEDSKSVSSFSDKINQKIEAAKQEFNLSAYPEESQNLIKYMGANEGDLMKVFENESITGFQSVLAMTPEERVALVVRNQLINDKVPAVEINEKLQQIAQNKVTQTSQEATAQDEKLVNLIDNTKEFASIPMTDKLRASLKNDLKSGEVNKLVDSKDPETRLYSFMMKKYGKQINAHLTKRSSEDSRRAYNKSTDKHLNRLHKSQDSAGRKKAGHEKQQRDPKKGWDTKDIE